MNKEEYTEQIQSLIEKYSTQSTISDKEMFCITNLFYKRDWNVDEVGHSADGLTFQRGMQLGMELYRQITEKNPLHKKN